MSSLNTNQSLDISADKLSAPIEDLNLERRAFHMLKRVDIKKISQIVASGKSNVLSIRNIGPLLADRIFLAVADYLGISEDALADDEIINLALEEIKQEKPLNPLNASVDVLDLPIKTILLLRKAGVFRIGQLIESKSGYYENIDRHFMYIEIKKIDRALRLYLNDLDKNEAAWAVAQQVVVAKQVKEEEQRSSFFSKTDLNLSLKSILLNDREWLIVKLRSVRLLTLEEIAAEVGGVTRERVRQIIDQVNEKIRKKLDLSLVFFDYFDERSKFIRNKLKNKDVTTQVLAREFKQQLLGSNLVATMEDLEKFIALVRLLVITNRPWVYENFEEKRKELTFLVCLAEPVVEKHKRVHQLLELEKENNRRVTYKEIARRVLLEAKRPLHWREIAEKAYKLGKRERFETRALYHVLLAHEDVFVRVGQGTYELAEWGGKQVEPYTDIIASVLRQENRSVSFDLVLTRVSNIRPVKRQTVIMYLDMHPRFYKSINGTYGLRTWLPPREKQNLRTPEWLVEDSKSFERVERSKQRGYDVDSIVDDDNNTNS